MSVMMYDVELGVGDGDGVGVRVGVGDGLTRGAIIGKMGPLDVHRIKPDKLNVLGAEVMIRR